MTHPLEYEEIVKKQKFDITLFYDFCLNFHQATKRERERPEYPQKLFKLNFKSVLWTRGFIIQKGDDPHIYFLLFFMFLYIFEIDTANNEGINGRQNDDQAVKPV